MQFLVNTLISAIVIACAVEFSKRSSFMAAILVSIPISSLIALSILHVQGGGISKVTELSHSIFWLVLPSLGLFLLLPFLLKLGLNYWASLAMSCAGLSLVYYFYAKALLYFEIMK